MKTVRFFSTLIICVIVTFALTGCGASHQARKVDIKEAILVNPAILEKGKDNQALYRYKNPKLHYKSYKKIIIDPVILSKGDELDEKELENFQKLANNAYLYLQEELKKDYEIVQKPEKGAMRIQMAILAADPSAPVRTFISTILPTFVVINAVKYSSTGRSMGSGAVTAEFKATDSLTGKLIGAILDRRVGGANIKGTWDYWMTADDALQYWAKGIAYGLCLEREGTDCVEP